MVVSNLSRLLSIARGASGGRRVAPGIGGDVVDRVGRRGGGRVDSRPHEKRLAMTIEIKRGGELTGYWSEDGWDVEVVHNTPGKNIEIK